MVVVGVDVHKRTHTFVVVDGPVASWAVTAGHRAAVGWARERFGADLVWAVEDCRQAREELDDVIDLTGRINQLERRITGLVTRVAPTLLATPGVGALTATKLVGEAAGVTRFKSEAAFARHTGIAPIPVWSGNTAGRVRLTRSGNRQLNAALHRIAVTQIRMDGLGKAYYEKKKSEGMSNPEVLR